MTTFDKLKKFLHEIVDHNSDKCQKIDEILNLYIIEYKQLSSLSYDYYHLHNINADNYFEFQNKAIAAEFGRTLFDTNRIKIEKCDPEDYRDILTGKLPDWSHYEIRRLSRLWVLK